MDQSCSRELQTLEIFTSYYNEFIMLNIIVILPLLDIQQGIHYSSCSSLEETTILSTERTWKALQISLYKEFNVPWTRV